jgi:hypothetical protein
MLAKLLGIILVVVGGILSLGILFPLIGNIIGMLWLLIKLVIPVVLIYVGYRLLNRDDSY